MLYLNHLKYPTYIHIVDLFELEIKYEPFGVINEGQSLDVCCHSKRTNLNLILRWFNPLLVTQEKRLTSPCFHFDEILRNDTGVYTCIAEYEGGVGTKNITLLVSCKIYFFFSIN